jgi:methylenetetrahydrofolate reductase (NADPH)
MSADLDKPAGTEMQELALAVVDLVRRASTEITTHDEDLLPALANKLPTGMVVYVAHTPKASLDDVVRVAVKAQALGFRASPHIVARRLPGERALKDALRELNDGGVEQVLLVAGDLEGPVGKFTSTLEVMDTGLLETSGIKRAAVAGHPEGHKSIGPAALLTALRHKQAFAARTGIKVHIVTQFGFNPGAVCAWDRRLTEEGISLPVHVGIAGPTPLPKLIKFAMQCGVGASMHSLVKNVGAMANLARLATTPDQMLLGLIRGRAEYGGSRLVQPHFYAFGGTIATATWLRAAADGRLTVQPDGRKFVVIPDKD